MAGEVVLCPNCQVAAIAGEDGVLRCPKCNGAFGQSPAGEAKLLGTEALEALAKENADLKEKLTAAQQRERDLRKAVAAANDDGHKLEVDEPPEGDPDDPDDLSDEDDDVWN